MHLFFTRMAFLKFLLFPFFPFSFFPFFGESRETDSFCGALKLFLLRNSIFKVVLSLKSDSLSGFLFHLYYLARPVESRIIM